jgi:hypothetical protein
MGKDIRCEYADKVYIDWDKVYSDLSYNEVIRGLYVPSVEKSKHISSLRDYLDRYSGQILQNKTERAMWDVLCIISSASRSITGTPMIKLYIDDNDYIMLYIEKSMITHGTMESGVYKEKTIRRLISYEVM